MKKIGFLAVILFVMSCLNDKNSPIPVKPISIDTTTIPPVVTTPVVTNCSPDTVYFNQTILPLIISNCAMSGCHDAISRKDGVILTDYTNIMREVKVSSPSSSDLYKSIVNGSMPPKGPLTSSQISSVLKWMQQGAKNNSCVASGNCISTNVSYAATILPILKTNCTGCHSGTSPSAGIDLNSYASVKIQASNGKLIGSISHAPGFIPMPSKTSTLSACEINQIKAWVSEGIKNN